LKSQQSDLTPVLRRPVEPAQEAAIRECLILPEQPSPGAAVYFFSHGISLVNMPTQFVRYRAAIASGAA
jgi:hypothetical protein